MKNKEATNMEIAISKLYEERIGLVAGVATTKVSYYVTTDKLVEAKRALEEYEATAKDDNLQYNKGTAKDLKRTLEQVELEASRQKKQIEAYMLRIGIIEDVKKQFEKNKFEDVATIE